MAINPTEAELKEPQLDYGLTTHSVETFWEHRENGRNTKVGASAFSRRNTFEGRNFMPDYNSQNFGFFALGSQRLPLWKLDYGLRYDYNQAQVFDPVASTEKPRDINFDGVAAATSLKRDLKAGSVQLDLATMWRAPAINELYSSGLHHGAAAIEQGNGSLGAERSYALSATYRSAHLSRQLEITAYANYVDDYIYLNPKTIELTIQGAFPRFDYEQDDALFFGVDARYGARLSPDLLSLSQVNMVWAENLQNGTYFINIPAHQVSTSLRYGLERLTEVDGLFLAANINYTAEQFRTPELFPFENLMGGSDRPLPESFDFMPPPDGYLLVGIQAGIAIGNLSIGVEATNLFNKSYRNYLNRFRYYAYEMGRNFTLRLNYKF